MASLIDNLSDTALWVAIFRAEESERPDAVFKDPFARRLAGERGEQIANAIKFSRQNSWSFVARTWLIDDYIKRHVNDGYDMVINMAAGLDTRPYRMSLPSSLKWVEVDMPAITEYKEKMMANENLVCNLERVKLDLGDREKRIALFERLGKQADKILLICEGLLIYLTETQVAELATDLSVQKSFRSWIFDIISPGLMVIAQKEMGNVIDSENQPFKFAPATGELFFESYGWKWIESRSQLKTAAALDRLEGEIKTFAAYPEPDGPKGDFPWSGICLLENTLVP